MLHGSNLLRQVWELLIRLRITWISSIVLAGDDLARSHPTNSALWICASIRRGQLQRSQPKNPAIWIGAPSPPAFSWLLYFISHSLSSNQVSIFKTIPRIHPRHSIVYIAFDRLSQTLTESIAFRPIVIGNAKFSAAKLSNCWTDFNIIWVGGAEFHQRRMDSSGIHENEGEKRRRMRNEGEDQSQNKSLDEQTDTNSRAHQNSKSQSSHDIATTQISSPDSRFARARETREIFRPYLHAQLSDTAASYYRRRAIDCVVRFPSKLFRVGWMCCGTDEEFLAVVRRARQPALWFCVGLDLLMTSRPRALVLVRMSLWYGIIILTWTSVSGGVWEYLGD